MHCSTVDNMHIRPPALRPHQPIKQRPRQHKPRQPIRQPSRPQRPRTLEIHLHAGVTSSTTRRNSEGVEEDFNEEREEEVEEEARVGF